MDESNMLKLVSYCGCSFGTSKDQEKGGTKIEVERLKIYSKISKNIQLYTKYIKYKNQKIFNLINILKPIKN